MSARGFWLGPAVRFLCVLSALFPWLPQAQAATPVPKSRADDFQQVLGKSGLIFEGTVTAIEREPGPGSNAGNGAGDNKNKIPLTYRVSFQVKQGVRGVRTGTTLVIREWAGLWQARTPRYRVGEHDFLFLYPPNRGGLTSTVGGSKGKLSVNGGQVALPLDWSGAHWLRAERSDTGASANPAKPVRVSVALLVQRIEQAGIAAANVAAPNIAMVVGKELRAGPNGGK